MKNEFEQLDSLFAAKERVQLEIGWACNDWLEGQRRESRASDSPRAALTYALSVLSERYADTFSSNESARKNITTWMRVTRYFTLEVVKNLPGHFTFHHLRKCYVGGVWPNANGPATQENINKCLEYAKEHDGYWPPVNSKEIVYREENLWEKLISICARILESELAPGWQKELARKICDEAQKAF